MLSQCTASGVVQPDVLPQHDLPDANPRGVRPSQYAPMPTATPQRGAADMNESKKKRLRNVSYTEMLGATSDTDEPPKIPIVGDIECDGLGVMICDLPRYATPTQPLVRY